MFRVATLAETLRFGRAGCEQRGLLPKIAGGSVPGGGYALNVAAVAMTAATAKTVMAFTTGANTPVEIVELGVSSDGTAGNVLAELCYSTAAGAGTTGTAPTTTLIRGPAQTLQSTVTGNYSAEPTVLVRIKAWRFALPGGPLVIQFPLGREPNSVITAATSGKQICLRVTSSTASNVDAYMEIEE